MENQLAPVNLVFLHIALLKSWNLVLIAREKFEGYRGTWHECYYKLRVTMKVIRIYYLLLFNLLFNLFKFVSGYLYFSQ